MTDEGDDAIKLGELEFRESSIDARLVVDVQGRGILDLTAYDASTRELVSCLLDRHQYAAIQDLLSECELVYSKLKACENLLPVDLVPHPMSLTVEIGKLDFPTESLSCKLTLDRQRIPNVSLVFSNADSNDMVYLSLSKTDYKRLKEWLRDVERRLVELHQAKTITEAFVG